MTRLFRQPKKLAAFGARLRKAREAAGMSAAAAADCLAIQRSYLYRIEAGIVQPGVFFAVEIAQLYGVSVESLVLEALAIPDESPVAKPAPPASSKPRNADPGFTDRNGPEFDSSGFPVRRIGAGDLSCYSKGFSA